MEQTDDPVPVSGHRALADLMGRNRDVSIFRRYAALNNLNLLYLQAEIERIEVDLTDSARNDALSDDSSGMDDALDSDKPRKMGDVQRGTILELRERLREYNEAILEQVRVARNPVQLAGHRQLAAVRDYLDSKSSNTGAIQGANTLPWESAAVSARKGSRHPWVTKSKPLKQQWKGLPAEVLMEPASRRQQRVLPMSIHGETLCAYSDTGVRENAMSRTTAEALGLEIDKAPELCERFELANGKLIMSIGQVIAACSFARDPEPVTFAARFHVFESLIKPVLIGNNLLEETETLTKNTHRQTQIDVDDDGPMKILHLQRPERRLKCYLDHRLVHANPDTGAEMNLVSASFAAQHRSKTMLPNSHPREVQFADGSIGEVSEPFVAKVSFTDDDEKDNDTSVPKRHRSIESVFYVLESLTTDVLLGGDLLYDFEAFERCQSSFIQAKNIFQQICSSLNPIVWLPRFRWGKSATDKKQDDSPKMTEYEFRKLLSERDGREINLQAEKEQEIAGYPADQQPRQQEIEDERKKKARIDRARWMGEMGYGALNNIQVNG